MKIKFETPEFAPGKTETFFSDIIYVLQKQEIFFRMRILKRRKIFYERVL